MNTNYINISKLSFIINQIEHFLFSSINYLFMSKKLNLVDKKIGLVMDKHNCERHGFARNCDKENEKVKNINRKIKKKIR
jgi:hypothetical protein